MLENELGILFIEKDVLYLPHIRLLYRIKYNLPLTHLKYFRLLILALCGILTFPSNITAENVAENDAAFVDLVVSVKDEFVDASRMQTVRIHYRVNRTVIERDYMSNAQSLDLLDSVFTVHQVEDIAYIVITGCASPEGPSRNNDRLAEQRAAALKNHIMAKYPGLYDDQIVTIPRGENWDGLEAMIKNDENVPYREELLKIISSNTPREEQKRRMAALGGGRAYKYLHENILPHLRGGVSSMIYFRDRVSERVDTVYIVRVDTVYLDRPVGGLVGGDGSGLGRNGKKPFYIAIKTNLVYDAALLPNLAVEIPFGRNYQWSAAVEGDWSWWDTGANKYNYHRVQMVGAELRRWFWNRSGNPLNGWYAGLYGFCGDYDIRLFADKNSDIGQQSLWSYSGGVSFGYAMPVARRLNLEFGLGAGYFGGKYKKYDVSDCQDGVFPVLSTHRRNYIGVTKVNVSLVWQIGSGVNVNNRKGVARW